MSASLQNQIGLEKLGDELEVVRYAANRKYRVRGVSYMHSLSGKKVGSYISLTQLEELIRQGKRITVKTYPGYNDRTQETLRDILVLKLKRDLALVKQPELIALVRQ